MRNNCADIKACGRSRCNSLWATTFITLQTVRNTLGSEQVRKRKGTFILLTKYSTFQNWNEFIATNQINDADEPELYGAQNQMLGGAESRSVLLIRLVGLLNGGVTR